MDDVKRPTAKLTQAQASKAYELVCEKYGEHVQRSATTAKVAVFEQGVGRWPSGPVLVRNFEGWYSTTPWAIVWEGGPEDWTSACGYGGEHKPVYPAGVFTEPINGFALGLHPT